MRLSIIIPVYNVEDYIEKCVLSLQQQDIPTKEYEIIIINDGSPDNSREVVLRLMQQFDNIVFIDQVNKGVSLARNAGMDRAKGKYILFIDPDDYVEPNSFARVLNAGDDQKAQIVFLGFKFLNVDSTVKSEMFFSKFKSSVYSGIEAYYNSRIKIEIDPDRAWAILYESSFVNKMAIRYIPDVPYLEDGEFIARILCLAERCIFEGGSFYMRTTREGSATNSNLFYSDRSINGFLKAAYNLKQFCEEQPLTNAQRILMNQPLAKFVLLAVESSSHLFNMKKIIFVKQQLTSHKLDTLSLEGVLHPYTTYAWLYNISPYLLLSYLRGKNLINAIALKLGKLLGSN